MQRRVLGHGLEGILFLVALVACPASKPKAIPPVQTPDFLKIPPYADVSRSPSPSSIPAELLRPLKLPHIPAGQRCPISKGRTITVQGAPYGGVLGRGPAFLVLSEVRVDAGGVTHYKDTYRTPSGWWLPGGMWWVDRTEMNPVLVRGEKLDGSGPVLLQGWGPLVGTVKTINDGHTDVELATGSLLMPATAPNRSADGWTNFPPSDIAVKGPGCYGLQVDGTTFSYSIIVRFAP